MCDIYGEKIQNVEIKILPLFKLNAHIFAFHFDERTRLFFKTCFYSNVVLF